MIDKKQFGFGKRPELKPFKRETESDIEDIVKKELKYVAYPTVWDALWEVYCWKKAKEVRQ